MKADDRKRSRSNVLEEGANTNTSTPTNMDTTRTREVPGHITIPSETDHITETNIGTADDTPRDQLQNGGSNPYLAMDVSGIDTEIARRNAMATEGIANGMDQVGDQLDASTKDFSNVEILRARTNTPTGAMCNDIMDHRPHKLHPSDDTSSKRTVVYNQAMSLMTERCPSTAVTNQHTLHKGRVLTRHNTSMTDSRRSSAIQPPTYFYVEQNKPTPMPPLQAWRGFNGNVYFEPIKVNTAQYAVSEPTQAGVDKCSEQLQELLKRPRRAQSSRDPPKNPVGDQQTRPIARSMTDMNSARSNSNSLTPRENRKMVVLDKNAILSHKNENIHEDIIWILGQESTGSLCLSGESGSNRAIHDRLGSHNQQPPPQHRQSQMHQAAPAQPRARASSSADKEKICRGSVAHKIYTMKSRSQPFLSVTGGRYYQQTLPSSPLLRTQTQYSLSNQRCINSPDVFGGGMDKLPPLEQLRASLKHIEPDNQGNLMNVITPLDRIKFEDTDAITKRKPFVKYSAEVMNSAKPRNRHTTLRHQKVM